MREMMNKVSWFAVRALEVFAWTGLSAVSKALMDARVFAPWSMDKLGWFGRWMKSSGVVPIIKIDDGWHTMQMLMFLFFGIGIVRACWFTVQYTVNNLYGPYKFKYFVYALIIFYAVRALAQGIFFEGTYALLIQ